jgi:hypothetical protein
MKMILVLGLTLLAVQAIAQENLVMTDHNSTTLKMMDPTWQSSPQMVIKYDGTIEIDGVPIERLSDPEIKESIKKIAESMSQSSIGMMKHYERQTEALLNELALCREELEKHKGK